MKLALRLFQKPKLQQIDLAYDLALSHHLIDFKQRFVSSHRLFLYNCSSIGDIVYVAFSLNLDFLG